MSTKDRNEANQPQTVGVAAVILTLVISLLSPLGVAAQEGATTPGITTGVTVREEVVRMPDGIGLTTVIYLPPGDGPFPTVFLATPYGTDQEEPRATRFAEAGYATVTQNVRGQGGSEGEPIPFLNEIPDLSASLDWILDQEWSDGRVGLIGNSSQSYSAQLLASTGHPSIRALINISGLTDPSQVFFPGGAFRLNTLYPWLQFFYLHRPIRDREEWARRFSAVPLDASFEWQEGLLRKMAAGRVDTSTIEVPTLHVTGWNDVVYRQTLLLHDELAERDIAQKLVVGPWMHNYDGEVTQFGDEDFGPDSILSDDAQLELFIDWFDRYVRGKGDTGEAEAHASVFIMGPNAWQEFDSWPPSSAGERTLFLTANASRTGDDGGLALGPGQDASVSYPYDPNNTVPTFGGVNSHLFPAEAGPRDQAALGERDDVLVFSSEPLDSALTLAGPQRAILQVSSDAPDADFVVKLVIVRPDGYSRIVEDGVVRARYRDSFDEPTWLEPGRPTEIVVDLGSTAIEVPAGHRIGIQVASSNFPKYDRNPSTRQDPQSATELRPSTQTLYLGGEEGSRLVLSVLE